MTLKTRSPRSTSPLSASSSSEDSDFVDSNSSTMTPLLLDKEGLKGHSPTPRNRRRRSSLYSLGITTLVVVGIGFSGTSYYYAHSSPDTVFGSTTTTHIYDTILVGAGWSGLSAASQLTQDGITNFVVLEGRETLGGRSRTVYPFAAQELAVELGSAWLYENTEPYEQALELQVPFGQVHYEDPKTFGLYDSSQGEITGASRQQYAGLWEDYCAYSEAQADTLKEEGRDVPYREVLEAYLRRHSADHHNKHHTQKVLTPSDQAFLRAMVHAQTEIEYAAPLGDVSAQLVGDGVNECVFCGAEFYVPVDGGGFDKFLKPLAQPFASKIRYQSKVTKIEYDVPLPITSTSTRTSKIPQLVTRVTYTDLLTGESHTILTKTVLVTVPLGVLKRGVIDFQPPLPAPKQTAIDTVGFGILNKCILYWDTPQDDWWPAGREVLTLVDSDHNYTTMFNDKQLGNGNHFVLSAWIAGDSAKAMELESNETIANTVYDHLVQMMSHHNQNHPNNKAMAIEIPRPSQVIITRWGHDEFAYGSYSYSTVPDRVHGPLLMEGARRELGLRTGSNLFWAGEATHEKWSGTTVGAYRSGQQVAADIQLTLLQQQKQQQQQQQQQHDDAGSGSSRVGGTLRHDKKRKHKHHHKHSSHHNHNDNTAEQ